MDESLRMLRPSQYHWDAMRLVQQQQHIYEASHHSVVVRNVIILSSVEFCNVSKLSSQYFLQYCQKWQLFVVSKIRNRVAQSI